jgi:aspartate/methionine/tyrosine aminotransferase
MKTNPRWDSLKLSYTEPSGLTPLRREAAALYGGALTHEQLLVLAPEEGVYLTMRALLRPGDRVVGGGSGEGLGAGSGAGRA